MIASTQNRVDALGARLAALAARSAETDAAARADLAALQAAGRDLTEAMGRLADAMEAA